MRHVYLFTCLLEQWCCLIQEGDKYSYTTFVRKSKLDDLADIEDLITMDADLVKDYGFSASELIQECTFDRSKCDPEIDFVKFIDEKYGACFTFNRAQGMYTNLDLIYHELKQNSHMLHTVSYRISRQPNCP